MRIGLIGCGRWGSKILRDLRALGASVDVVARTEESRDRAQAGGALSIRQTFDGMPDVDGIVIATPTSTHAAMIEASLTRGVPVFCEKPLDVNPIRLARIIERSADRLFVMDKWRYHPGVEMLRDITQSGELGDLLAIRVRFTSWGNRHSDVDGAWVLLPHANSIFLEILGGYPRVDGATGWRTPAGDVEIIGHMSRGTTSCIADVSTLQSRYERSVTLHFEQARASLDDGYDEHVTVVRHGQLLESSERRPFPSAMPLHEELRAFLGHLDGGPPPRSSAAEGLRNVELVGEIRDALGW